MNVYNVSDKFKFKKFPQGPVMAKVLVGLCILTNNVPPSGEKHAPAVSDLTLSFAKV